MIIIKQSFFLFFYYHSSCLQNRWLCFCTSKFWSERHRHLDNQEGVWWQRDCWISEHVVFPYFLICRLKEYEKLAWMPKTNWLYNGLRILVLKFSTLALSRAFKKLFMPWLSVEQDSYWNKSWLLWSWCGWTFIYQKIRNFWKAHPRYWLLYQWRQ